MERLVAILRAVHPAGVARGRSVVDRVAKEVAELEKLRLLVPSADGGGGGYGTRALDDAVGQERRWRINVPRGFVEDLGEAYEKEGVAGLMREYELFEG